MPCDGSIFSFFMDMFFGVLLSIVISTAISFSNFNRPFTFFGPTLFFISPLLQRPKEKHQLTAYSQDVIKVSAKSSS